MTASVQIAKPKIPALTGLRFFLAIHLILFHFLHGYLQFLPSWIKNLVSAGYFSTSTFFMLSGFILGYIYLNEDGLLKIPFRKFMIVRLSKVYPVHLLFFVLMLPFFFIGTGIDKAYGVDSGMMVKIFALISQVFLLDAWNPFFLAINASAWSVSALLFFYVVFPFFSRSIQQFSVIKLWRLFFLLWSLYLIYPTIYVIFQLPDNSAYAGILHRNPLIRLPEFLMGVILSKVFLLDYQLRIRSKFKPFYSYIKPWVAIVLLLAGLITLPACIPYPLLHNGLFAPFQTILLLSLAFHTGRIPKFLSSPLLSKLSDITLILYLGQWMMYSWCVKVEQLFLVVSSKGWPIIYNFNGLLYELTVFGAEQYIPSLWTITACIILLIFLGLTLQEKFVKPVSNHLRTYFE